MKKLLMVLILGMFLISFTSAWEFDNTYEYFDEVNTAVIHNCDFWIGTCLNEGEVLATVTLTSGHNKLVGAGIDTLVGEFNFTTTGNFSDVFGEMYLTDMKNGNEISRGKQYKYKKYKEISVDDYNVTCTDELSECEKIEIGSHIETEMNWIPINNPNNNFTEGVTYEIGVFVDVEKNDWGDWKPEILGVEIPEWAEWSESIESGMVSFWGLNNDDLTDYFGINNATNTGTINSTGILGTGRSLNGSTYLNAGDLGSFSDGLEDDSTFAIWFKTTTTTQQNIMGSDDGSNLLFRIGLNEPTTGKIYLIMRDANGNRVYGSTTSTITNMNDGNWHLLIMSIVGSSPTVSIYVDNTSYAFSYSDQTAFVNFNTFGSDFFIGAHGSSGSPSSPFTGNIDQPTMWNRSVAESERSDYWNAGVGIEPSEGPTDNPPEITLTSPTNNSNLTSSSQDFIATITDDWYVQNASLKIDDVIVETSTSHVNGSYTFSRTITTGPHNWSVLSCDNSSQCTQSETWFYNYTQPPISVDLINPSDLYTSQIPLVNFSCNAYEPKGVTELNFILNGVINETVTNSTQGQNLSISKEINLSEGNYNWSCSAENLETSEQSANRSLTVNYSEPIVTLISPINDTTSLIEEITFIFNATDINGIKNATLLLDGAPINSSTSGVNGSYSFTNTIASGKHVWSVKSYSILDKLGISATWDINIHSIAPTVNITSPSGAVGSIVIGENETLIYNISEAGENLTEHLVDCWYVYPQTNNINSTSNFTANPYWNVRNGTISSSSGDDVLRPSFNFGDSNYYLHANLADNNLFISDFTSEIPNCISTGYFISALISSSEVGQYACTRNENNKYNIIKMTSFSGETSVFESYDISPEIDCLGNTTEFLYQEGKDNMTVFAEDEYGFIGNDTSTWEYQIIEINQTYINQTTEGSTQDISALINLADGLIISAAVINYNGTQSTGTSSTSGENTILLRSGLITPGVETTTNLTFFWSIVLSGGEIINLTEQSQTVINIEIDNCSTFTNKILSIGIVDEETQVSLTNTTLEIAINIFSADRSTEVIDFSDQFDNINPVEICLSLNISEDTSYSLDSIIRYIAPGYANEYYNIVDYTLNSNSETQNIILYDLNISDSTEFQLTFTGEDFLPVENALVSIERQYISENVFKTVELPKTDSNGQTILHLVRNEVIYNIIVTKDGEILGNFANVIAFCEDFTIGACSLPLNAISNISLVFNYDDEIGLIYEESPQYNETTRTTSFSFSSIDGTTKVIEMRIERRDVFGNRTICENTLISASGTISCQISGDITDTSLMTIISIDGEDKIFSNVIIDDTAYGQNGYAMFFIFAIGLLLMFSGSKTWTLVGISLNYIFGVSLGLIVGGIAGVGATGIFVLTITVVGIWQLNKGRKQ